MTNQIAGVVPATQVVRTARRTIEWERWGRLVLGTAGVLVFLLAWEISSRVGILNPAHVPPATEVFARLLTSFTQPEYWEAISATLWAWLLAVVISTSAGVAVGLLIGSSTFGRAFTNSTIEILRPIPSVGLIPIAALIFGVSLGAELLIVCIGCFWLILIQVMYGVADVDRVASDTVRTLGLTWHQRVRYLVFPTLLPYLVTGLRLVATVALIICISAEMIVGTPGIGREVNVARITSAPDVMISFIITSGVLGILINLGMRWIERKVLFWHASVRG